MSTLLFYPYQKCFSEVITVGEFRLDLIANWKTGFIEMEQIYKSFLEYLDIRDQYPTFKSILSIDNYNERVKFHFHRDVVIDSEGYIGIGSDGTNFYPIEYIKLITKVLGQYYQLYDKDLIDSISKEVNRISRIARLVFQIKDIEYRNNEFYTSNVVMRLDNDSLNDINPSFEYILINTKSEDRIIGKLLSNVLYTTITSFEDNFEFLFKRNRRPSTFTERIAIKFIETYLDLFRIGVGTFEFEKLYSDFYSHNKDHIELPRFGAVRDMVERCELLIPIYTKSAYQHKDGSYYEKRVMKWKYIDK